MGFLDTQELLKGSKKEQNDDDASANSSSSSPTSRSLTTQQAALPARSAEDTSNRSSSSLTPRSGCRAPPLSGSEDGGSNFSRSKMVVTAGVISDNSKKTNNPAATDGEAVFRGFAKAMDTFEDSLRAAAIGSEQPSCKGGARKAKGEVVASGGAVVPGKSTMVGSTLYQPVARGLTVESQGGDGVARGSLKCLTLCARRPLIAGIARCETERFVSSPHGGCINGRKSFDKNENFSGGEKKHQGTISGRDDRQQRQGPVGGGFVGAEIQVWNYRTKRALVKHRFGGDSPGEGSVAAAGASEGDLAGGRGGEASETDARGGGKDATVPVAISLHPSGDCIAVAFPNYINIFYIVGGGGSDAVPREVPRGGDGDSGGGGKVDTTAPGNTLSAPLFRSKEAAHATVGSKAELTPLATLRSDQREFMTKGMFSAAGEEDPVINYDPVSAVHFSPGGHLLAVVTGKVIQELLQMRITPGCDPSDRKMLLRYTVIKCFVQRATYCVPPPRR